MKKKQLTLICIVLLALGGCAHLMVKSVTLSNSFDPAEAQAALEAGNNTIKGSAVILRNDGVAVTCAGRKIELIPVTAYSSERMQHIYGNTERGYISANPYAGQGTAFTNDNPEYRTQGMRVATGDAQGFFTFNNVKDGEYFVTAVVTWSATQYSQEGGVLMKRVKVSSGQNVEIVLSPHD